MIYILMQVKILSEAFGFSFKCVPLVGDSIALSNMGGLGIAKILNCFSFSISSCSCLCTNPFEAEAEDFVERDSLIKRTQGDEILKLKDALEPKTVILRVSMHCNGCARKVEKHIRKMEGVTSFKVNMESKKVVVMGDITPFEVLESVSKVKFAELWVGPYPLPNNKISA